MRGGQRFNSPLARQWRDDLMAWHIDNAKGKAYWGCTDDEDMDISDQLTDVHRS